MRAFLIGLQFLTRISIVRQDNWTEEDFGRSVRYFPLIGAVLGVIYAFFAWLFFTFLPAQQIVLPRHFCTVILLVLPILLTGGLHCDGFMDTMDGVFSGRSRERMLEIMKDSRVGSNGVFAFGVLLLFDWAMLLDMEPARLMAALFVMPIVARLMMMLVITLFPYARPQGMGKAFAACATKKVLCFAFFYTLVLIFPAGWLGGLSLLTALCFTIYFARYVTRLLGGVTGDVYGATATLSEAVVLFTFLAGSQFIR